MPTDGVATGLAIKTPPPGDNAKSVDDYGEFLFTKMGESILLGLVADHFRRTVIVRCERTFLCIGIVNRFHVLVEFLVSVVKNAKDVLDEIIEGGSRLDQPGNASQGRGEGGRPKPDILYYSHAYHLPFEGHYALRNPPLARPGVGVNSRSKITFGGLLVVLAHVGALVFIVL